MELNVHILTLVYSTVCVCVCVWMRVVCLSLSRGFGVRGYRVATVDRSFGNRANCW